jgi:sugar lactone lactonase YvrE
MTTTVDLDIALAAAAGCAEAPLWDDRDGVLLWVDNRRDELHRFDPRSGADAVLTLAQPVGMVVPRAGGGLVAGVRDGFAAVAGDGSLEMLAEVERDVPSSRMNEGRCDSRGRFWGGTMAGDPLNEQGRAALYRLDADHSVRRMVPGTTISNGLGWSPDDRRFYFVDSLSFGVDAWDYDADTGEIRNRTRLVDLGVCTDPAARTAANPDGFVVPDGLAVDAEGCLWIAMWGGGCVRRHAPDGRLLSTVVVPVAQVSSCGFGGDDLGDLYVTTAACDLDDQQLAVQPHAGGVFVGRPGVAGLPNHRFAG